MENEYLRIGEAARLLKRSPRTIRNLCWMKKLPYLKPGGRVLMFRRGDLIAWIEAGAVLSNDQIEAEAARR